jgi:hypothetical protein
VVIHNQINATHPNVIESGTFKSTLIKKSLFLISCNRSFGKAKTMSSGKAMSGLFGGFALAISMAFSAFAQDVTVFIKNSGPAMNLQIYDVVCQKPAWTGHLPASGGQQVNGLCERDAARLVSDINIIVDGNLKYQLQDVPTNSFVDAFTGQVNAQ